MRIFNWVRDNILLTLTLFLLVFIPLYPKLPIIGISHTWVYVRLEDFFVLAAALFFMIQLIRKKVSLRTPLTIPIFIFWGVGLLSTAYAIFFIFPYISNVFPNVAVFHYLRKIEYISVFFIAFFSIKSQRSIKPVVAVLSITLLLAVFYGMGQKLFGFPAFLTMNEEFAKGIPLRLSSMARIPSTFAGHYDLAAYLVFLIPIIGSMIFGFKNLFVKIFLFFTAFSGLILLLMTASRISFVVYLAAISIMLFLQKKKILIIPVIIASILLLNYFQVISSRFGSTFSSVDVVIDARTGKTIGIVKEGGNPNEVNRPIEVETGGDLTGENLPPGSVTTTGSTKQTVSKIIYRKLGAGGKSTQVTSMEGDFVIKKVFAYDVSFTTRFQGEWPRAMEAFKRNILLGSGYSSISLATDGNYIRILGEAGILGFLSFILIFLTIAIYIKNVLPDVLEKASRSWVLGVVAGGLGLAINAIVIDVFEASKVAFILWLILGITLGILHLNQKRKIDYIKELKNILISSPAIIIYLFIFSFLTFFMIVGNYFVGDDFIWLRWAADCKKQLYGSVVNCEPAKATITRYFTDSEGFFFRPGTKIYFYFMYAIFWLHQEAYHLASISIHAAVSGLIFLLAGKILKSKFFAVVAAVLFVVLSIHAEAVFWVSATGHIISSAFILLSLLLYIYWRENKNKLFLISSVVSSILAVLFYELGIIIPILVVGYSVFSGEKIKKISRNREFYIYFSMIPLYLLMRAAAQSHWLSGDYSYRLSSLPFNFFGNMFGYFGISIFGARAIALYEGLRIYGKLHPDRILITIVFVLFIFIAFYKFIISKIGKDDKKILFFSFFIFIIGLLPFIALGNISPRYVYLSSFGVIIIFVLILRKAFERLSLMNKYFGFSFIALIVILFSAFNILELEKANKDWQKAGKISNNMLITFNNIFPVAGATPPNPVFYFVNPPIRWGEAWVFPVGLKDALWFTFQDVNLTVYTTNSLNLALDGAEGSTSARVYRFDKDGNLEVVERAEVFD